MFGSLLDALLRVVNFLLGTYMLLLVLSGLLRMARADESSPFMRGIAILVDPPSNWLKRRFPRLVVRSDGQYIDLATFVLLLIVGVAQILLPVLITRIVTLALN